MKLQALLIEFRRRGVYRAAAFYSASAWALLQIVDIVFPILGLPDWSMSAVLLLAALGFPIALTISWFFDLTAQGLVETTAPANPAIGHGLRLSPVRLVELALILALMVSVGFLYIDRLGPVPESAAVASVTQRPSVAVVPFENRSDNPDVTYFGDGLAEEIIQLLTRLSELNVAARASSFRYRTSKHDITAIGRLLGVQHVLSGRVNYSGGKARVTAELVDASNGYQVWSDTFDRDFENISQIQQEIALQVVSNLELVLSPSSRQELDRRSTVDAEAYDYYLQGRDYLRRATSSSSLAAAVQLLRKATELDPDYAAAFAGLCDTHLAQYQLESSVSWFEQAEKACHRALTLDNRAVAVYVALGNLYLASGQLELAEQEYRQALNLNDATIEAYDGLARIYVAADETSQAEHLLQQAITLQPGYWRSYNSMGKLLFEQGREGDAIPYYLRISELMPDSSWGFNNLGAAYYMTGQFADAEQSWNRALALNPTGLTYANVASSLYFQGQFEQAVAQYHRALAVTPDDAELWGNLADAYRHTAESAELAPHFYEQAIALTHEILSVNPKDAFWLSLLGYYYANIANQNLSLEYLGRAERLAPQQVQVYYNKALALCALEDYETAAHALEQALELGYPWQLARADAGLSQLASLSRFRTYEARHTQSAVEGVTR